MHQKLVKYYIHKYDIEITLKIAFTFCKGLQQVKKNSSNMHLIFIHLLLLQLFQIQQQVDNQEQKNKIL